MDQAAGQVGEFIPEDGGRPFFHRRAAALLIPLRGRGTRVPAMADETVKHKICLLGSFAVGKTSLVSRFVSSLFSEAYLTTVGVKVDKKVIDLSGGPRVTLLIWDVHGEDLVQTLQTAYLRGAAGYLLVADGTRATTLAVVRDIQRRVNAALGPRPFQLLVNKADLRDAWEVTEADLQSLRDEGWTVTETSARDGTGVDEAFYELAARVVAPDGIPPAGGR